MIKRILLVAAALLCTAADAPSLNPAADAAVMGWIEGVMNRSFAATNERPLDDPPLIFRPGDRLNDKTIYGLTMVVAHGDETDAVQAAEILGCQGAAAKDALPILRARLELMNHLRPVTVACAGRFSWIEMQEAIKRIEQNLACPLPAP